MHHFSPCPRVCDFHPPPTKTYGDILAMKRHNSLRMRDVFEESTSYIASRIDTILFVKSIVLLCIYTCDILQREKAA
jgi:hypothetical protein